MNDALCQLSRVVISSHSRFWLGLDLGIYGHNALMISLKESPCIESPNTHRPEDVKEEEEQ